MWGRTIGQYHTIFFIVSTFFHVNEDYWSIFFYTSFLRRNPKRSFSISAAPNVANHHTYTSDNYKTHSLELCKRLANLGGCESAPKYFYMDRPRLHGFYYVCPSHHPPLGWWCGTHGNTFAKFANLRKHLSKVC